MFRWRAIGGPDMLAKRLIVIGKAGASHAKGAGKSASFN
jgi:hypothetical protein